MIARDLATAIIVITFTLATIVGSLIIQGPPENKVKEPDKSCVDWKNPNKKCNES